MKIGISQRTRSLPALGGRNGISFSHVEDPPAGGTLKDKYMLGDALHVRFL
jgi:hypothetical protein